MRPEYRGATAAIGVLVLSMGCGTPDDPPPVPDNLRPPPEAAGGCSVPVPEIVGTTQNKKASRYAFVDMEHDASCQVWLEQEQCVLGIFDDCTSGSANSPGVASVRQWSGELGDAVNPDGTQAFRVRLSPYYVRRPTTTVPDHCAGLLDESRTARLDCFDLQGKPLTGHRGFMLQRIDPMSKPFAKPSAPMVLPFGPSTPRGTQLLSTVGWVPVPGRDEVLTWIASSEPQGGGLYRMPLSGDVRAPELIFPYEAISFVTVVDGAAIIVAGDGSTQKLVRMSLATGMVELERSYAGTVSAIAAGRQRDFYVGAAPASGARTARLERWDAATLTLKQAREVLGSNLEVITIRAIAVTATTAITVTGTTASELSVFVAGPEPGDTNIKQINRFDGALVGLPAGLGQAPLRRSVTAFNVRQILPITPMGATAPTHLGFVLEGAHRYQEFSLTTGEFERAVGVPTGYFTQAGAYDPVRDRVWLLAKGAAVTYVDRATHRAPATPYGFDKAPELGMQVLQDLVDLVWMRDSRRMIGLDGSGTSRIVVLDEVAP